MSAAIKNAQSPAMQPRILRIGELRLSNAVLLAPLDGYTDLPFRLLCRKLGASMAYTEFTNSCGVAAKGSASLLKIGICERERPVGCQLYGRDPKKMAGAARIAAAQRPDLIDLNFGCPARKVSTGAGGSQLMREPERILEIAGAVRSAVSLPVTCKLRLGWDEQSINVLDICLRLQDLGVSAVTIHGRTRCQKYRGQADWEWIARVKDALEIPVIGNGDVRSGADVCRMFTQTGVDAVMIGRAAIERPWIFREVRAFLDEGREISPPTLLSRVDWLLMLFEDVVAHKGTRRGVRELRKLYPTFLRGYEGLETLRAQLVRLDDVDAVRERLLEVRELLGSADERISA